MNKLKRLLKPAAWTVAVLGVFVLLGFVERSSARKPIAELDIRVLGEEGVHFIDEERIRAEVFDQGGAIVGALLGEVDLARVEERLRNDPNVADAHVYTTLDGVMHVQVRQRVPIVRVFDGAGESFYIDRDGHTMPLSDRYTARVLVVTGLPAGHGKGEAVESVHGPDAADHLLDDIHRLASFITSDPFWNALIDHAVVTADEGFELVPRVGLQRVMIGDATDLEQRLAKLKLFYEKGMPQADWRRYDRIDLRFNDQIVCTKRTTP
jgi:cell division protein FtsQ